MCTFKCCGQFLIVFVVVVAALYQVSINNTDRVIIPEPPGLGTLLLQGSRRHLTQEEIELLDRDGVIAIRGLIKDTSALKQLETSMWPHMMIREFGGGSPWLYNGASRALLRDGPLGELVASAVGAESVRVSHFHHWGFLGQSRMGEYDNKTVWLNFIQRSNPLHADDRHTRENKDIKVLTVWLAITDAPNVMTFYPGSHKLTSEVGKCAILGQLKEGYNWFLYHDCVANVTESNGYPAPFTVDAVAGDAFVFNGDLVHATESQPDRRLAVCARFNDGRVAFDEEYSTLSDVKECDERSPVVYPRSKSTMDCYSYSPGPPCSKDEFLPRLLAKYIPFMSIARMMPCAKIPAERTSS